MPKLLLSLNQETVKATVDFSIGLLGIVFVSYVHGFCVRNHAQLHFYVKLRV